MSSVTRKTQVFEVLAAEAHVGRHLVEVVEAHERARPVQVEPPGQALHVVNREEEFVREAERILHPDAVAHPLDEALAPALGTAAELLVVSLREVDVFGGAHPERHGGDGRNRADPQHEVVVDELLEAAQVDLGVALLGHDEAEDVDVELARLREVVHDDVHIGAAQNVRRGNCGGGDEGHGGSPR